MIRNFIVTLVLLSSVSCSDSDKQVVLNEQAESKASFNIDQSRVTVSGISSGGYMASQYHIAYSKQVSGAALLASGPYGCAKGDLKTALSECMNVSQEIDITPYHQQLMTANSEKLIDSLDNLKRDKVWLFHGQNDYVVSRKVVDAQKALYQKLGVQIKTQFNSKAGHGFPTLAKGVECSETKSPFINQCQTNIANEFLSFLYPEASPNNISTENQPIDGRVIEFLQQPFVEQGSDNTLADKGYIFVPTDCLAGAECQLHIAFHGCQQNVETIGKRFIEDTGINQWASVNNLVVLYPQTKASYLPLNPKACWDWWGYTGADYLTKSGTQLKQVHNMVQGINRIVSQE